MSYHAESDGIHIAIGLSPSANPDEHPLVVIQFFRDDGTLIWHYQMDGPAGLDHAQAIHKAATVASRHTSGELAADAAGVVAESNWPDTLPEQLVTETLGEMSRDEIVDTLPEAEPDDDG